MKALLGLALLSASLAAHSAAQLQPCRLKGLEYEAQCGVLQRPLDPAQPQGAQIDLHFAVITALARNKKPDPVFFFAGGPGQSAVALAAQVRRLLGRFGNHRDVVLIDQRGTGASAPLKCEEASPMQPLRDAAEPGLQAAHMRRCLESLIKLPYIGRSENLALFTTTIAMADANAVREALGAAQINLVGGSYGTRAVLEYMRQFPHTVRRAVLDGVAPPDMVLPASFSADTQAAFDTLLGDCERDTRCQQRYPQLRADWQRLLASVPREIEVNHPRSGAPERLTLSRAMLLSLVRAPLYAPHLSAALPLALSEAAQGRMTALVGLASALAPGKGALGLAQGMHFAVVCAEDMPGLAQSAERPGADFGDAGALVYRQVCADWPRAVVPSAFYRIGPAPAATLVLSGGLDPVTPPRHGQRVAQALGPKAHHAVVAHAGHGVMGLGCMRDVVYKFINARSDELALAVASECAKTMPRPTTFMPLAAAPTP